MASLLVDLNGAGVSPWLDNLKREMFASGELVAMIEDKGIRGQTSNPSIFQSAISKGQVYNDSILSLAKAGKDAEAIVWDLMVADVQKACDVFRPLFDSTNGGDGFVSLELDPTLAHETAASLTQAEKLVKLVDRPNLMIKVPATKEGLPVVTELIAQGVSVNVTLLFAVERYAEVIDAWMTGLERRAAQGLPVSGIHSVASFFISRVDTEADKRMDAALKVAPEREGEFAPLRGKVAVANARIAYELFQQKTADARWAKLQALGADVQRPLWASTSTKNPNYADTLYVDDLIGEHCVNTMPDDTIVAFVDHGHVKNTLNADTIADAHRVLDAFAKAGFDLDDITNNTLMTEGVDKFAVAYTKLVDAVKVSREKLLAGK